MEYMSCPEAAEKWVKEHQELVDSWIKRSVDNE